MNKKGIVVGVAVAGLAIAGCGGSSHSTTTTTTKKADPPKPVSVAVPHVDPQALAACAKLEADSQQTNSANPVGWFGQVGGDLGALASHVSGQQQVLVYKAVGDITTYLQSLASGNSDGTLPPGVTTDITAVARLCGGMMAIG